MRKTVQWLVLIAAGLAAHAQVADQVRRATVSGTGSASGKCTIEVRVDSIAEVDLYGDSGRLRTVAGQPASWSRLECSSVMPYTMSDFRFRGIDGRGSVKLAQDPRNNNSMAVIRIEDPRGGSEGFTFEVSWSGGSADGPTTGFQSSSGWGTPATTTSSSSAAGTGRGRGSGWGGARALTSEQAIDLCRAEVRTRAERDYSLRNIDITSAAVDTAQNRRNWVTGTFRGGQARRGGGYKFNCEVDYSTGQLRGVELLRADGTAIQTSTASGYSQTSTNQNTLFRNCQDAVVARTNRDGYQNVSFGSTQVDPNRTDYVIGNLTAARGPVTDTFDFACSMDLRAGTVRNIEVKRR